MERGALGGVFGRGLARLVCRQPGPQTAEVQDQRGGCPARRDHGQRTLLAPEAVADLDERAEAAGVDVLQAAEIHHEESLRLAGRVVERGPKLPETSDVQLSLRRKDDGG